MQEICMTCKKKTQKMMNKSLEGLERHEDVNDERVTFFEWTKHLQNNCNFHMLFLQICSGLAFHSEPLLFFSCVRSPDQHQQRWSCPRPGEKAHPGRGSCNPRWFAAFLSAGEASGATYTGPAHTGNHMPSPCARLCPVHANMKDKL